MAERVEKALDSDQIKGLLDAIDDAQTSLLKAEPRDALDEGVRELSVDRRISRSITLTAIALGLKIAREGKGNIPGVDVEAVLARVVRKSGPNELKPRRTGPADHANLLKTVTKRFWRI